MVSPEPRILSGTLSKDVNWFLTFLMSLRRKLFSMKNIVFSVDKAPNNIVYVTVGERRLV